MIPTIFKKVKKITKFLGDNKVLFLVAGALFLAGGMAYQIIFRLLARFQMQLLEGLQSGFWPTTDISYFKREIVSFVLIQCILIVLALFTLAYKYYFVDKNKNICIPNYLYLLGFLIGMVGLITLRDGHLRIFFLLAVSFFLAPYLLVMRIPAGYLSKFSMSPFITFQGALKNYRTSLLLVAGIALIIALLIPGYKAWHPLALPNDYYEVPSSFNIKNAEGEPRVISFYDAKNYLENNASLSSKRSSYRELFSAFDAANGWSQETGRILYHHSYVLVPAKHWLKYGLDGSVLYLYGFGNTIAYALMMASMGGTISDYFAIYPLSLLIGLLVMCLAVAYCSKNRAITFLAAIIGIYSLYQVGFTAALLAFSFSSMRFVGLFLQVVGIFYYLRSPSTARASVMCFTSVFSLFWNGEFGIFGAVGQLLALIPQNQNFSIKLRFLAGLFLIALPVIFKVLIPLPEDFINSVYLGFFQINMPFLTGRQGVLLILLLLLVQALLLALSLCFKGPERIARLCLLPILALSYLKIFYNPSTPHAAITYFFIAPLLLLYLPNSISISRNFLVIRWILYIVFLGILSFFCWKTADRYEDEANYIRKYLVDPVVTKPWANLGESLPMALDEAAIQSRIDSIKKYIEPSDKVLLLSPFDHLLSIYVNPRKYCGHFELISNLASKQDVEKVVSCVRNANPHALIVLDEALTRPCPDLKELNLVNSCSKKLIMKNNVAAIMDQLPQLDKLGQEGDLTFFRPKSK